MGKRGPMRRGNENHNQAVSILHPGPSWTSLEQIPSSSSSAEYSFQNFAALWCDLEKLRDKITLVGGDMVFLLTISLITQKFWSICFFFLKKIFLLFFWMVCKCCLSLCAWWWQFCLSARLLGILWCFGDLAWSTMLTVSLLKLINYTYVSCISPCVPTANWCWNTLCSSACYFSLIS